MWYEKKRGDWLRVLGRVFCFLLLNVNDGIAQDVHPQKVPKKFNYSEKHSNGTYKVVGTVVDDEKTGKWFFYYDNGLKKSKGRYKNGFQHGKWFYYDRDGLEESTGRFIKGEKHGIWWIYNEEFLLFENGNLIKREKGCKKCGGI